MGMFDYVRFECEIPEKARRFSDPWQTKDFDCEMKHYSVRADGQLIKHETHPEHVPEEQRPYFGKPEWEKGGFYRIYGSIKHVPDGDIEMDFTGEIEVINNFNGEWIECTAIFKDGKLISFRELEG